MTVTWWVLGNKKQTEFLLWSGGATGPLEEAAVYRSLDNAEKKLKTLHKCCPGEFNNLVPHEIKVTL